jgi:ADP-heptose:LPS heptosyltransferase
MMKFFSEHPWALDAPLRIAISPTHRRPVRRWPVERYATLADHLTRDWGAFVTWLWGPGEESEIDHIMGLCRESTYKAPKTSFRELAALIGNVDLFIGNSNGPSHVAVAAGTPSLQLHGPTKALSWCPMNDRHWAIQAESMDSIGVTEVVTQLDSLRARLQSYAVDRHDRGVRVNWAQPAPAMPK